MMGVLLGEFSVGVYSVIGGLIAGGGGGGGDKGAKRAIEGL